jgi:hypothetical protein
MPAWIDVDLYGIPDLENRGFKIANDQHGPPLRSRFLKSVRDQGTGHRDAGAAWDSYSPA